MRDTPPESEHASALAVLVRSVDVGAPRFALDLVGTSVAAGEEVTLALFGPAVGVWLRELRGPLGAFGRDLALVRAMAEAGGGTLSVYACSAAVAELGEDPDALEDARIVDCVLGWPGIWREIRLARLVVI